MTAVEITLWGRSGQNGVAGDVKDIKTTVARIERRQDTEGRRPMTRIEKFMLVGLVFAGLSSIAAVVTLIVTAPK